LTALWEAITGPSPGQGRKTALVLLDESALGHLVELFNREQTEPSSGRSVAEMAQAFVEGVTSKPGRGVCFTDEGWYPRKPKESALARLGMDDDDDREMHLSLEDRMRRGLHNRILSNVVRKLGGKVVDDNGRVGEWAIKVFEACPELVAGYWPNSALAVDPKLNARWIATMAYISSIVSLPCPDISTFRQPLPKGSTLELPPFRPQPPAISTMIESILPSPLTKTHMTKGLSHPDHLVQLVTAQTLARCLQKLSRTRDLLRSIEAEVTRGPGSSEENPWSVCIRQLEMEARRRVPELMVVIAFAQKSAIMGQVAEDEEVDEALASKSAMLTEAALRLFGLYHQAIPAVTRDTKFDVGRLLVSSSSVKQERRERKDANANAGSVADETMSQGSVGSMGSAGTAGMGGGFGYAKGDVKGFEALSQVHVLQLLGSVKGWQWINKACKLSKLR
jgi:nucleolar pre-ribosomal-associated protein 1